MSTFLSGVSATVKNRDPTDVVCVNEVRILSVKPEEEDEDQNEAGFT